MLKQVIHINGKSGSGKDMYASCLRKVYNACSDTALSRPDQFAHILSFGFSLKRLSSDLTNLNFKLFDARETKDEVLSDEDYATACNTASAIAMVARYSAESKLGIPASHSIFSPWQIGPTFPVNIDYEAFNKWLQENRNITPRDFLKKLGSDGGIVPSWTWVVAVRTQLEFLHNDSYNYVAIISDTRRLEELMNTDSWCLTRKIPTLAMRINHWDAARQGCEHITETEFDSQPDMFDHVFSPQPGFISVMTTLSDMVMSALPVAGISKQKISEHTRFDFLKKVITAFSPIV